MAEILIAIFLIVVFLTYTVGMYVFCWTQSVQVRIWDRALTPWDRKMANFFRMDIGQ